NDTIFLMLMGHPDFDPARLHLRGGWAAAGPEVMQKIRDVMGVPAICNAYGQSEASPNVIMSAHDDDFALRAMGWARPHPGMEVRVVDAGGAPLPAGARGEIQVRGWSVMKGYYNMPEATARALSPDGWLSTGDLGEMDAEGRLRMVGRLKDMFRVGGENVAPLETRIDGCRQRCADYKVPRYLDVVESFEHIGMTGSSKVQKNKLRDYALRRFGLERQP